MANLFFCYSTKRTTDNRFCVISVIIIIIINVWMCLDLVPIFQLNELQHRSTQKKENAAPLKLHCQPPFVDGTDRVLLCSPAHIDELWASFLFLHDTVTITRHPISLITLSYHQLPFNFYASLQVPLCDRNQGLGRNFSLCVVLLSGKCQCRCCKRSAGGKKQEQLFLDRLAHLFIKVV